MQAKLACDEGGAQGENYVRIAPPGRSPQPHRCVRIYCFSGQLTYLISSKKHNLYTVVPDLPSQSFLHMKLQRSQGRVGAATSDTIGRLKVESAIIALTYPCRKEAHVQSITRPSTPVLL
jgi:hypothetical protein